MVVVFKPDQRAGGVFEGSAVGAARSGVGEASVGGVGEDGTGVRVGAGGGVGVAVGGGVGITGVLVGGSAVGVAVGVGPPTLTITRPSTAAPSLV